MTTYTVYPAAQGSERAESGLTPTEVVHHIYTDDGRGYRVEEELEDICDDDGEKTGEKQVVHPTLGKAWRVYFTRAGQQFGEKSHFVCYGDTEDLAIFDFLSDAWEESRWEDSRWFVITDEQFAADQAKSEEE